MGTWLCMSRLRGCFPITWGKRWDFPQWKNSGYLVGRRGLTQKWEHSWVLDRCINLPKLKPEVSAFMAGKWHVELCPDPWEPCSPVTTPKSRLGWLQCNLWVQEPRSQSRSVVARGWGVQRMAGQSQLNGSGFPYGVTNILELDRGGCQPNATELHTLKWLLLWEFYLNKEKVKRKSLKIRAANFYPHEFHHQDFSLSGCCLC